MAVSPVLADSSYYITLLRQKLDPLAALALAGASRDLAVCGVVRCEVGRALRHENTLKRFQQVWDVMINVPTDNRLWEDVERMVWTLDRQGNIVSLTDVVIACCAIRIGAVVLTFDHDFFRIPGLRAVSQLDR
jgi:predicted nucleic acid-binding protein